MRIGVGVSTAPDAGQAAVEAAAHARDELADEAPTLAVLLGSRSHTDKAVDVLDAVQEMLEPPALIGCVAQTIVAGRREIEDKPAVAVWLACRHGRRDVPAGLRPHRLGWPAHRLPVRPDHARSAPTAAGPIHIPVEPAHRAPQHRPARNDRGGRRGERWAGTGRHPAVLRPGRAYLSLVGVRLPGVHGVPIVSQGCRPIGDPYIVTGADGALITELGGRSPLQRLREIVAGLPPDEQELVSNGLQVGIVVDEHLAAPGQGDFLIRGLRGADSSTGAIEVGEVVEVGATVQFQVRDAVGADKDLRLTVEQAVAALAGRPVGALLFTCNGRGRRMFGVADHDASTIEELLQGGIPLAGFFAAGEIGPIAGRNALHAFTASMALFIEDAD